MRRAILVATIALLIAGITVVAVRSKPAATASRFPSCTPHGFTSVGEKLPDCAFEGFNGSPDVRLRGLTGKPLVLNFWASWCIDCVKEMPRFQGVFAALGGRVQFVGMNVIGIQGETMGAGRAFASRAGVHYLLAFDPGGLLYGHFSNRTLLPTTVFVDARGVVRERHYGQLDERDLRAAIRRYFNIT